MFASGPKVKLAVIATNLEIGGNLVGERALFREPGQVGIETVKKKPDGRAVRFFCKARVAT